MSKQLVNKTADDVVSFLKEKFVSFFVKLTSTYGDTDSQIVECRITYIPIGLTGRPNTFHTVTASGYGFNGALKDCLLSIKIKDERMVFIEGLKKASEDQSTFYGYINETGIEDEFIK